MAPYPPSINGREKLPRRQAAIIASMKLKELCSRNVRAKKNGGSTSVSNIQQDAILPIEVITGILSFLPPKHLMRFQLVCKEWKFLIFGHYFMERYKDCNSKLHYWYNVKRDLSQINPEPRKRLIVSGCDGLLLFMMSDSSPMYCLWNPATRLVLELPDPHHERKNGHCVFTYVPATKNYRLVLIYKDKGSNVESCEMLTPGKSNAWKRLEFPVSIYPISGRKEKIERSSIVLAGAMVHYIRLIGLDDDNYKELVSLDVGAECFTVNSLPKGMFKDWKKARAFDWEGKLAFSERDGENLKVSVLDNYKTNRWSKKMKINLMQLIKKENVAEAGLLVPLFAKSGDLWVWLEGCKVCSLSIKTGQVSDILRIQARASPEHFYTYKPTLVTFEGMKPDTEFNDLRHYVPI